MKLTTALALSAVGMTLSSLSVWALVPTEADATTTTTVANATTSTSTGGGGGGTLVTRLSDLGVGAQFTAGSTLMVDGRIGHATLDGSRDNETFLFLDVHAPADQVAQSTAPVDLAIVIDRSGSMAGQRMENAIEAARGMIGRLRDGDTISVVAYNNTTSVIVPPTTIDSRTREQAALDLRGIEPSGHTCISCGIEAGMGLLGDKRGGVKRMLLLSDGEANVGIRDVDGFRRLADRARGMEATISSIGVDVEYNERVMFALAQGSNGRHYFVQTPSGLPRIFDEELQTLVRTVASEAVVEIDLADGVELIGVADRAFTSERGRVRVPMGSFSAREHKTVLARVRVPRGQGRRDLAEVRMLWDDLTSGKAGTCEGKLVAMLSDDPREVSPLDPVVENRLARSETGETLTRANELFTAGDLAAARRELDESRKRLRARKTEAGGRAASPTQANELNQDFDAQLKALEEAESGFGSAASNAPAAPAQDVEGKRQVRSNADKLDDLFQ
jgi:Ca-activated chloride channel family protein